MQLCAGESALHMTQGNTGPFADFSSANAPLTGNVTPPLGDADHGLGQRRACLATPSERLLSGKPLLLFPMSFISALDLLSFLLLS